MKASELRIGNYVYDAFNEVRTINYVLICNVEKMRLTPIPITEEWLLRFGFEDYQKTENPDYLNEFGQEWHKIYFNGFYYMHNDRGKGYEMSISGACYDESTGLHSFSNPIEFVHHLQNLYFALTGEELVLTNNPQPNDQH
jgi:hypothetical protein